jgi:hypothetical protein
MMRSALARRSAISDAFAGDGVHESAGALAGGGDDAHSRNAAPEPRRWRRGRRRPGRSPSARNSPKGLGKAARHLPSAGVDDGGQPHRSRPRHRLVSQVLQRPQQLRWEVVDDIPPEVFQHLRRRRPSRPTHPGDDDAAAGSSGSKRDKARIASVGVGSTATCTRCSPGYLFRATGIPPVSSIVLVSSGRRRSA